MFLRRTTSRNCLHYNKSIGCEYHSYRALLPQLWPDPRDSSVHRVQHWRNASTRTRRKSNRQRLLKR